ncbi:MAG: tetratricopeptide repeat protein, partial [Rubrobacteraceae bacterium]
LIYVPPISTPLANIIGPWVLVRLSWPLSLAAPIVIAWVIWEILDYLGDRLERTGTNVFRYATPLLPVLLMVALIAATSPTAIASVRSANGSGEVPQDQTSCSDPVFSWMQKEITEPSTVLAPYEENSCIPAQSSTANVVTLRGLSKNNRVEENMFRFYSTFAIDGEDERFLRRDEIDYVLLSSGSPLNAQMQHLPGFMALDNPGDRYRLYGVDRSALVETPAVTANTLMTNDELDAAAGYYSTALGGDPNEQFLAYMGFGLLNTKQGLYADAAANYEQALEIDREQPSLYPLLSTAYNSAGEADLARLALETGVDRFPNSVELRTNLSALLMSQDPAAAANVQREIVKMFPEVPEYRIQLGTYLSLSGDDAAANRQFERAIRKNPLSAQLHADAGSANQTAGRKEAAIQHYERALQLDPDLEEAQNQLEALRGG